MSITLMRGNCMDLLPAIRTGSIDVCVTDTPYGETNLLWDKRVEGWAQEVRRVLKPHGSLWAFGSMRYFMECAHHFQGWRLAQDVVWEKHNGTNSLSDRFRRVHEIACHFYPVDAPWSGIYKNPIHSADAVARAVRRKGQPQHWRKIGGDSFYQSEDGGPRLMRSVLCARSEHGRAIHPTQKPTAVLEALIAFSCPPHGTVLDTFAGSGSTGWAARAMGCSAILMERDAEMAERARLQFASRGVRIETRGFGSRLELATA